MDQRSSLSASDTTYHSFHDIELQEPPSPPRSGTVSSLTHSRETNMGLAQSLEPPSSTSVKMQRQDSGYGSHPGSARNSMSPSRRESDGSFVSRNALTAPLPRTHARPATRRSAKSYPQASVSVSHYPRSSISKQPPVVYFQFPTPSDLVELTETPSTARETPVNQPPPTTHYWTSDSTRRLEYAAIDAASRGVKGWIRRHLVPECFNPRHVAFDDDSGSVRRYRLELEDEGDEKNGQQRRRSWHIFSLRKSSTV